jgi:lysozyme family protein
MNNNFYNSYYKIRNHEGGFVNHPSDPGGADVEHIYRVEYWNPCKCDDLPRGVDHFVFDYAINIGPGTAIKDLQLVVQVTTDGIIGPKTLAAVRAMKPGIIIIKLAEAWLRRLERLSTWKVFGNGWENRIARVTTEALNMVK